MEADDLKRWLGLCQDVQADESMVRAVFEKLCWAYEAPSRAYHNLTHIRNCLTDFDRWLGECDHPAVVELAIWFHDVVYDSRRPDNEQQSALLARDLLAEMKIAGWVSQDVQALILLTRHDSPAGSPNGRLIQDVDLAILATDPATFDRYEQAVRREYDWVEDRVFWPKRSDFLQSLLRRDQLFLTTSAFQTCEGPARHNLERSIAQNRG